MAENDNTNLDEILATDDIYISEEQTDIEVIETVEVVEVDESESYVIDTFDAFPALGEDNENLRHALLNGRELADQHPITAITGLREELNEIERLKTVSSDDRNQANYYLWEDENILQEDRVGYFVSVRSDINEIGICTSESDIFGVTVDGAGFIGAQSDIPRDYKYGLVVHNGIVHVRCELSVNVGDYVVSNDYGYAKSNKNGYKVIGRHQIDGIEYAEITLVTPINRICELSDNVENVNERMDNAETNIVAAINMANAAYNKAGEVGDISEEAIKNALEALNKSDKTAEKTDELESIVSSTNETAVQAKAIAESAVVSAETIRKEAVETSNKALADVNDLIEDLEPITIWTDPETGNAGAEYFTTYVKDGVATKAEIQTVETMTEDNKSAIEKSAESFRTLVSSVDKYSVGEYSQSYGLTQEQAKSILKVGMIYVPTKHSDSRSHSETFEDTGEINEFTPGNYYEWDGTDWIEVGNSVAFFSEEPVPSGALTYWYVDSNEAPDGYEPYTLYMYDDKWVKVNIFYNNPNNRIVSSISQEVDNISLEVVNARGSAASLTERIDEEEATIQSLVSWSKGGTPEDGQYNLATIKQTADDAGASIAQVVTSVGDINGDVTSASIITAINKDSSGITISADKIDIDASDLNISADDIDLTGVVRINDYITMDTLGRLQANEATIIGKITAQSGAIGGWEINQNTTYGALMTTNRNIGLNPTNGVWSNLAFWAGGDHLSAPFRVTQSGNLDAKAGTIGGWEINSSYLRTASDSQGAFRISSANDTSFGAWIAASTAGATTNNFEVRKNGSLYATGANITGTINATSGNFTNSITIGGTSITVGQLRQLYRAARDEQDDADSLQIRRIDAWNGMIGNWYIDHTSIYRNPSGTTHGVRLAPTGVNVIPYNGGSEYGVGWHGVVTCVSEYYANGSSDENVKNSIESFTDEYDILFDNLMPCRYKYDYGTSDRYHTGYIAQEVVNALEGANLTTQDFAAVVHLEEPTQEGSEWMLRRDEFVALNTWQIQKAKARITELENKVAELEELIKGE